MSVTDIDVATLLPQSGEIVLLDSLQAVDETSLTALTQVRDDGLFNNTSEQVPSFVAIEYIAQAIAAWVSYRDQPQKQPANSELLLDACEFESSTDYMVVGTQLKVRVKRVEEAPNGLSVFDGWVSGSNVNISARLSVSPIGSRTNLN